MKVYVAVGTCQPDNSGGITGTCLEANPVTEPLAITKNTLRIRGEWELEQVSSEWRDFQISGPDNQNLETGKIIKVSNTDFGDFVGKISSVSYTDSPIDGSSIVNLTVRTITRTSA